MSKFPTKPQARDSGIHFIHTHIMRVLIVRYSTLKGHYFSNGFFNLYKNGDCSMEAMPPPITKFLILGCENRDVHLSLRLRNVT